MKPHRILKSFPGSQHGNDHHHFQEGTIKHLSDDLARIAVAEGWAELFIEGEPEPDGEEKAATAPANKMKKGFANKSQSD